MRAGVRGHQSHGPEQVGHGLRRPAEPTQTVAQHHQGVAVLGPEAFGTGQEGQGVARPVLFDQHGRQVEKVFRAVRVQECGTGKIYLGFVKFPAPGD